MRVRTFGGLLIVIINDMKSQAGISRNNIDNHSYLHHLRRNGRETCNMYVCLCNALSDTQVDASIDAGIDDAHAIHPHLGCEVRCGRCIPTIVDMMVARMNEQLPERLVAAE